MFGPTITDMQGKYCGDCYDIPYSKPIYEGGGLRPPSQGRATSFVVSFVLALNRVNIIAVTTILAKHVGNGRCEHVSLDIMFFAIRASCSLAVRAMRDTRVPRTLSTW